LSMGWPGPSLKYWVDEQPAAADTPSVPNVSASAANALGAVRRTVR
jgi:hypothetical protein